MPGLRLVIELYAGYGVELTIGQLYTETDDDTVHDTELSGQIELAESASAERMSIGFTRMST